jgi:hypothetical protein
MNGKKKKQNGGIKITSQSFFLLLAVLALIYVYLLGDLDIKDHRSSDSGGSLPSAIAKSKVSGTRPTSSTTTSSSHTKPNLDDYIQGWNITKNVNWLLDFSIVGFPKTGTSTLMLYLKNQTQSVFVFDEERCELGYNQQVPLLKDLHHEYRPGRLLGIKCPRDLEVDLALDNYQTFFPETRFIVGVRNPIRWFESFYNFRVHNLFPMRPPKELVGRCYKRNQGVCTNRANFSQHLAKIDTHRKVFLYETSQLQSNNNHDDAEESSMGGVFLKDLQDFLGLETPLEGPMIHVKPGRKPIVSETIEREVASKKINICDNQHSDLRNVLRKQASVSADWILETFLSNPNVEVSSPERFRSLLQEWHNDPCHAEKPS